MYIINRKEDYADEFYYTVRSFLTPRQRAVFLDNTDFFEEVFGKRTEFHEFYFGTNECLEFNLCDIIDMVEDSIAILPIEYEILTKFNCASLDIINKFMNMLMDKAYDLYDVENSTEEQNEKMQQCEELYRIITKGN